MSQVVPIVLGTVPVVLGTVPVVLGTVPVVLGTVPIVLGTVSTENLEGLASGISRDVPSSPQLFLGLSGLGFMRG